jgi:hypothetical protein
MDNMPQITKRVSVLLACPLNIPLFSMTVNDLVEGVSIADPATYYTQVVLPADMNFSF